MLRFRQKRKEKGKAATHPTVFPLIGEAPQQESGGAAHLAAWLQREEGRGEMVACPPGGGEKRMAPEPGWGWWERMREKGRLVGKGDKGEGC